MSWIWWLVGAAAGALGAVAAYKIVSASRVKQAVKQINEAWTVLIKERRREGQVLKLSVFDRQQDLYGELELEAHEFGGDKFESALSKGTRLVIRS